MAWIYGDLTGYPALKAADAALNPPVPDPEQAAAALKAQMDPGPTEVPIVTVTQVLRNLARADGTTAWLGILAAASSNGAAKAAVEYNGDLRAQTIDLGSLVVRGMLAALVASSVITQVEMDAVLAIVVAVPKWDPPPSDQDIIHARSL